jgi:excisionase family DNA binding protein
MSFATAASELLTTRQAAELVGRSLDSVKRALNFGTLTGRRVDGFWRVRREDVLAWDATACRHPSRTSKRAYDRAAEVLGEYGSVTADELAQLLMVHVGNARKHLAILGNQGRAHRHDDGEWFPGPDCQQEEAAS